MIRVRVMVVALIGALALAGCASSGEPDDYDEVVAANFAESCVEANADLPDGEFDVDAQSFCGCTYTFFLENVDYDAFKSLNNRLEDEAGDEAFDEATDLNAVLIPLIEGLTVANQTTVGFGSLIDACGAGEAPDVEGTRPGDVEFDVSDDQSDDSESTTTAEQVGPVPAESSSDE